MTPAERAQAVALLTSAEALRSQGAALMHLAESQVHAANALLGAEPPSAEMNGTLAKIFGEKEKKPDAPKYFGSKPGRVTPSEGEASGT